MRNALAWAALALGAAGCGMVKGAPPNPFVPETRYVTARALRGGYLDVNLGGRTNDLRFLFPASETCDAVLRPEAEVAYSARGRYGQINGPGDQPCIPLGVGSLRVWRDKGPRPQPVGSSAGSPLPARPARFEVLWRDEAEIFLRGRFPLATWIGMTPAHDLVAVVPNSEPCRQAIRGGQATLEYRFSGPDAYTLMVKPPDKCPVVAFATPPPNAP